MITLINRCSWTTRFILTIRLALLPSFLCQRLNNEVYNLDFHIEAMLWNLNEDLYDVHHAL